MRSDLKKSLYVGLAAVSLLAASGFATKADAKAGTTITSNTALTTAPTTRSVTTNGSNALYTKAGTLPGARVVASKTTLQQYGTSNRSQQYFFVTKVATTNRGSVYYKVNSFDNQLQGWIYGGRATTSFGGGLQTANTTNSAPLPSVTKGYTLKSASANTLWQNPKWTVYGAQKTDMSAYKTGDTFTVTGAATKSREGTLYYQVVDDNNSAVTGWVYAGGLNAPTAQPTTNTTATKDNSVQVVYLNASGTQVGQTYNWIIQPTDLKSGAKLANGAKLGDILNNPAALSQAANQNVPSGYTISSSQPNNPVANVTVGSNYTVYVNSTTVTNTYRSQLTFWDANTNQQLSATQVQNGFPVLTTTEANLFANNQQVTFPSSLWDNAIFHYGGKLYSLSGTTSGLTSLGNPAYKNYTFSASATQTANQNAKFGDTIKLFYTEN